VRQFPFVFDANFGRLLGKLIARGYMIDEIETKSGEVTKILVYHTGTDAVRREIFGEILKGAIGVANLKWVKDSYPADRIMGRKIKSKEMTERRYKAIVPNYITELFKAFGVPLSGYISTNYANNRFPLEFLEGAAMMQKGALFRGFSMSVHLLPTAPA